MKCLPRKTAVKLSAERIETDLLVWCNARICPSNPITPDTHLLDEGYLDSLFVMDMVVHIEKQYGLTIDSSDISPRNFRNLRALAAWATSLEPAC